MGNVVDAPVIMVVMFDEGAGLPFKTAKQVVTNFTYLKVTTQARTPLPVHSSSTTDWT